jgi:predicted nucleic acid-binding protein
MEVLVDTSVWIDYFRGGTNSQDLDLLIDENLLVTNDLILTELIPYLKIKRQTKVIALLNEIKKLPLDIQWIEIIDYQVKCLKRGANGIGIPDLIIAQNAKQQNCKVYSLDKHFRLLNKVLKLKLHVSSHFWL